MTSYLNKGKELLESGQIKEAIDLFQKAIENDPSSPWPYYHLALALMKDGQLEAAVSQLQRSIELDPNLIWAHHYLGETLVKLGQLEEAVGKFERAIEIKPDLSWSYHHLGETLFKLGRWDEAIVNLRKAIGLNPDFSWSYHSTNLYIAAMSAGSIFCICSGNLGIVHTSHVHYNGFNQYVYAQNFPEDGPEPVWIPVEHIIEDENSHPNPVVRNYHLNWEIVYDEVVKIIDTISSG